MSMPLELIALGFAVVATVEWGRLPVVARIYLGVGTAFAVAGIAHPDMSLTDAVASTRDGIAVVLAAARAAGIGAAMISLATALHRIALR